MFKFVSSIGNAAYQTAAKTGLTAGDEMPPYPCALPLQVIHDSQDVYQIEAILDAVFDGIQDLTVGRMRRLNGVVADKARQQGWKPVDFEDSQGDLKLHTRPHVGPYNFALATLTLDNIPASAILREMHAQSLEGRKRYSSAIKDYKIVHRNPLLPSALIGRDNDLLEEFAEKGLRDWHIEYTSFHAPPPVANRDFFILIEKRYVPETNKYYIYGTSVDFPEAEVPKRANYVRGIVMFGWEFQHTADGRTLAKYISCMNPNGWAPTFLVGWMKNEIAKEIQHSRRLLYDICKHGGGTATKGAAAKQLLTTGGGCGGVAAVNVEGKQVESIKLVSSTKHDAKSVLTKGKRRDSARMADGCPLPGTDERNNRKVFEDGEQEKGSESVEHQHIQHTQSSPQTHFVGSRGKGERDEMNKELGEVVVRETHRRRHRHHHHHHHCRHHLPAPLYSHSDGGMRGLYLCHHCANQLTVKYSSKDCSIPRVSFHLSEGSGSSDKICGSTKKSIEEISQKGILLFDKGFCSEVEEDVQRMLQVEDARLCAEEEIMLF